MKTFKILLVENDNGVFEVVAQKRFCMNEYIFTATQVAVNVNGQIYSTSGIDRNPFFVLSSVRIVDAISGSLSTLKEITTHTIILKTYLHMYKGYIMFVEHEFLMFCEEIEQKPKED